MVAYTQTIISKTCGGHKTLTSITICKKTGAETISGEQKLHTVKAQLELTYTNTLKTIQL